MKPEEMSERDRIKSALMRQRGEMQKKRHAEEFKTIYDGNLCPICHHRHMVGVVCRKWRGTVCEKHCEECEHHELRFWHCLFRETEPIDTRKWKLVYRCAEKENLWRGILRREAGGADEARTAPEYIITDTSDANGDYGVVNADTGEIHPSFVAKFLEDIPVWVCVEYLPPGA